ncbi:MAG TPA: LysM peptidoglycan-binding domain-containing protein [Gemmatimonadales bacterium]|nr:LysM peptidoglycan-binding domain-containing protein [Gemmatimonadales bacterium]
MAPPSGVVDSLLRAKQLEDLAEAVRLAADSAADERMLAALEASHPADSAAEDDVPVRWDIDVSTWGDHERVRWYLDFFQGPGHERMQIWLDRMPRFEPMIRERLQKADMPADLVYLALIESGFSLTATSRAKAVGMWQFMRPTGRYYGLRVDRWMDERRDPVKATDAAVRFLSDLNARFGSLYLAAAAYNAGGGRISGSLRRMGITPVSAEGGPDAADADDEEEEDEEVTVGFSDADFFKLYDSRYLHRETKDYVPKLIAAALIAKEPRRYGFRPSAPAEPFPMDSIVVDGLVSLDVVARLADTTVTAIRELNPQYLRLATPPGTRSVVRLPTGKAEEVGARYAELPAGERVSFRLHVARKGETVSTVAAQYGVPASLVYDANPGLRGGRLRTGREVVVPTGGTASIAIAREVSRSAPSDDAGVSGKVRYHKVKKGETLSGIAKRYGVSQAKLKQWNHLSSSKVRTGQKLRVVTPAKGGNQRVASAGSAAERREHQKGAGKDASTARTHRVKKGETLSGIATRYGVTMDSIRQANGLRSSSVQAGRNLKIPARG